MKGDVWRCSGKTFFSTFRENSQDQAKVELFFNSAFNEANDKVLQAKHVFINISIFSSTCFSLGFFGHIDENLSFKHEAFYM